MKGQSMTLSKKLLLLGAGLAGALTAFPSAALAIPNPMLYLISAEPYTVNGTEFMRYRYDVFNKDQYPAAMFAAAPGLPPCGNNHNSSRSWVDFFDQSGHRLYGFCALGTPNNLGQIWFALPIDQLPPSYIYIEINDRQTNTKYRSNLADTVM
jgi:hypothetical protein